MKKIVLFFILMFSVPTASWAVCRYLGSVYDTGYGYRPVYNLGCSSGVRDHFVFFSNFPYTNTICLWSSYYNWHGTTVNLCPGFSTMYMNQSGKTNVADQTNRCWRWTCNSGVMLAGGQCVLNEAACLSMGMIWTNGNCTQGSFCSGWSGYNSSRHNLLKVGSCWQWRCKDGGFAAATNHADCTKNGKTRYNIANNPTESMGGGYVNNGPNKDGVFYTCSSSQYVTGTEDNYTCAAVQVRDSSAFDNCWQCTNKPDLIACIGGTKQCN